MATEIAMLKHFYPSLNFEEITILQFYMYLNRLTDILEITNGRDELEYVKRINERRMNDNL
jgi:hypothetical protein